MLLKLVFLTQRKEESWVVMLASLMQVESGRLVENLTESAGRVYVIYLLGFSQGGGKRLKFKKKGKKCFCNLCDYALRCLFIKVNNTPSLMKNKK